MAELPALLLMHVVEHRPGQGLVGDHLDPHQIPIAVPAAGDGMDTFRLSASDWTTATSGSPTEAQLVTNIKGTSNALQDKTATDVNGDATKVDWMDYYHCEGANNLWECAAFNPENTSDGVGQGYPRFGSQESAAGYLSYVKLTGASSVASTNNAWQLIYQGADTLIIAAAASAMALLAF